MAKTYFRKKEQEARHNKLQGNCTGFVASVVVCEWQRETRPGHGGSSEPALIKALHPVIENQAVPKSNLYF